MKKLSLFQALQELSFAQPFSKGIICDQSDQDLDNLIYYNGEGFVTLYSPQYRPEEEEILFSGEEILKDKFALFNINKETYNLLNKNADITILRVCREKGAPYNQPTEGCIKEAAEIEERKKKCYFDYINAPRESEEE